MYAVVPGANAGSSVRPSRASEASSFRAAGAQAVSDVTRNACSAAPQRCVAASRTRISPVKPAVDHAGTVQPRPSSSATGVPTRPFSTVKPDAASDSTATASPPASRNSTDTATRHPAAGVSDGSPSDAGGAAEPSIRADNAGGGAVGVAYQTWEAVP